MKVKFNHKTYETNKAVKADSGSGLGRLCFDIFKHYLDAHKDKSYQELQAIFNTDTIHKNISSTNSTKSVVFNELDFNDWYNNYSGNDSKRNNRYFGFGGYSEPVEYNGEKLYFTTQWDNTGIQNMINFAKKNNFDIEVIEDFPEMNKNIVKNIILYGSPGVGKTHNTNKLIRLIENGKSDKEIFETIKVNENSDTVDISDAKERVKFITFHQSFGYEDFIEGFRPNEEGNIQLEKGVFREICKDAQKNLEDSQKPNEDISQEIKFKKILDVFIDEVERTLEKDEVYSLTENIYIFDVEEDAFRYKGDNWTIHNSGLRMRFDILEKLYVSNVKSRKEVKSIDSIGGLAKQHATYFWKLLEKLYLFESNQNIQVPEITKIKRKNYYLVIDEINRGNISKIFGELITLIEEDKRDTLEVTLPYSKKPFKIPSNLYIIGTMNSTDKSIALIDIALRRRFTFLKMEPKADLINYQKARLIFEDVNKKVTETLGEDYQIGHSYFMKIQNDDDLAFVLEYKIIPLLEEYYYGDENRLQEIKKLCDLGES